MDKATVRTKEPTRPRRLAYLGSAEGLRFVMELMARTTAMMGLMKTMAMDGTPQSMMLKQRQMSKRVIS